jgi:hypothetical protein
MKVITKVLTKKFLRLARYKKIHENAEIRGAQKLEIFAINVSGDLSYAGW